MSLSITPTLIIAAAQKRGITARIISESRSLYRLDTPTGEYYYIRNITSIKSHGVNSIIAAQKDTFYDLATELGITLPATMRYENDMSTAAAMLEQYKRLVVKPVDQSHGNGVTVNVTDTNGLEEAIAFARSFSRRKVIVQQQIEGDDYRLLMIDGRLAAAVIRKPAFVIGDGTHTVAQLIEQENASDKRSDGYQETLTSINPEGAARYLGDRMQYVPQAAEEVRVMGTANVGKGGVAIDVTDTIDPAMVEAAKKIVDHFGMGLCGVDFLRTADGKFYMIEINTGPSLGLHENPFQGIPRNTPDAFLDWLLKP